MTPEDVYRTLQIEYGSTASLIESYQGSSTNYEFGVLGKNKLPITANMEIKSVDTGYNNTYSRDITPGILYPNISANNYWLGTSAKTFVQEVQNGCITFQGVDSAYGIGTFVSVCPQTTYTISYITTDNQVRIRIGYYDADGYFTGDHQIVGNGTPFTVPDNARHMVVVATPNSNYYNQLVTVSNLQLELDSTATTYEPYDPKHTIYGGWVDLISGEAQEEGINGYPYEAIILNGTENWSIVKQDNQTTIFKFNYGLGAKSEAYSICSHFRMVLASYNAFGCVNGFVHGMSGNLFIQPSNEIASTIEDFKAYLAEQYQNNSPVTVLFQAKRTPNTYHLAPTQLQTFLGQNNVWSNADYVEVEYDLHETQDILNRKNFIIANQPHIVRPAAAPLQNFTTDVPAPLKECKVHFAPVQDLHGYSKPWPAGGGKNIAKPYDNSYVSSTYVSFDYSVANGTFRCYGTASASSTHSSPSATNAVNNGATFTLPAGTYTLSIIDGDGANIYAQCVSSDETVLAETTSYTTFTTNESLTVFVRLKVAAAATVDKTVKIQLEKGSVATSYAPYENICPISGWTGLNLYKSDENLYLPNPSNAGYISKSGVINVDNTSTYTDLIPVNAGDIISFQCTTVSVNGETNRRIHGYNSSGTWVQQLASGTTAPNVVEDRKIFATIPSGVSYIRASFRNQDTNVRIAKETTIAVDWTSEAGTLYGGYMDLINGKLIRDWLINIHEIAASDGTPGGTGTGGNINYRFVAWNLQSAHLSDSSRIELAICNIAPYSTSVGGTRFWIGGGTVYMVLPNDNQAYSAIVAYAERDLNVSTYQLSPNELKTLRGANSIYSTANGNINIKYWTH